METIFNMRQHHGWSVTELEEMYPWELRVHVTFLKEHLREQIERARQQAR